MKPIKGKCGACAKARKFVPAPVRRALERVEDRQIDKRRARDAEGKVPAPVDD